MEAKLNLFSVLKTIFKMHTEPQQVIQILLNCEEERQTEPFSTWKNRSSGAIWKSISGMTLDLTCGTNSPLAYQCQFSGRQ
ncbi:hypothetical protein quinque_004839 [Culex quinquefasciatus]